MTVTINGTTGVSGVAGSASAPALIGSDADSGYYINSANEPNASVNGTAVWSAASTFGFKNRIINPGMVIDQRNAGASVSVVNGQPKYGTDRYFCDNANSLASVAYSVQQVSDAPTGLSYSLKATVTTSGATAAGDYQYIRQNIEGYNFADFQFGTANAQTFTLSFWVKSSLTGTFGGYLGSSGNTRFRVFSYTISAANTWEYKTVTITGDTTGTWVGATNGVGLQVAWSLACGTTYQGATGSWSGSLYLGVTGQVNVTNTASATWQITGVQLEKGSTATSFDYRPYGTELALCQRYYQTIGSQPGTGGNSPISATGMWYNATTAFMPVRFGIAMRTGPTVSYSSLSEITLYQTTTGVNPTNVYINVSYPTVADLRLSVASGGTSGQATVMQVNGGETKGVFFSAEL